MRQQSKGKTVPTHAENPQRWLCKKRYLIRPDFKKGTTVVLRVRPPGGNWQSVQLSPSDLLRSSKALEIVMNETGCTKQQDKLRALLKEVAEGDPGETIVTTRRSGVHADVFVTPSRRIFLRKNPECNVRFDQDVRALNPALKALGKRSGLLKEWKQRVAEPAGYSSIGVFVIGAALAPSLFEHSGLPESLVVNLAGRSTGGKTCVTLVAMSVQGAGTRSAIIPPDLNKRPFEEAGSAFNQLLLPIDDLSQLSQGELREVTRYFTYRLADGGGRLVSHAAMQKELPFQKFSTVALTSCEMTFSSIARAAGNTRQKGELARMLDLVTDADRGVFDRIPNTETRPPEQIARDLEEACGQVYGTALPAFLKFLAKRNPDVLRANIQASIDEFAQQLAPDGQPVLRRAARKVAWIFATLMLARKAGVVPWTKARIRRALTVCFQSAVREHLDAPDGPTEPTGSELFNRFQQALKQPGAVLEVRRGKADIAFADRGWIVAHGLVRNKLPAVGLWRESLKRHFPRTSELKALLAELSHRGLIDAASEGSAWSVRIQCNDGLKKPKLIVCKPEILN